MPLQPIVAAIWGEEKTGKTTLAFTFPRPIVDFDLDVGGYNRAISRFNPTGIETKSYPTPIQLEKMMGQQKDTDPTGKVTLRMPKKVIGMKELWQKIIVDFVEAVQREDVKTIVVDSATQLWSICHSAYLQELQEKQLLQGEKEANIRSSLLSIEYGEPNSRMQALVFTARSYGKNLVLNHYPRDVYATRLTEKGVESYTTGEKDMDGFKKTKALADIAILTRQEPVRGAVPKMMGKVTLSGLGIHLMDFEMQDPTYDKLVAYIDATRPAPVK
jgi:hypothetical protein